jgi:GNAT superfamily N-acetyltransferase
MTVTVRPAIEPDGAIILQFVRDLAEYEREPDAVEATEDMLAQALFGPSPGAEALIAETNGKPIGFALFFHNFSTWKGRRGLYLEDLYVTPEARGSGAGKALLAALAKLAVERGCARFEWSVLDWNEPAIGFYRSLGAVPQQEWTTFRVDGPALVDLAGR